MGHTHEEIDTFWGVYSGHLDFNDIFTVDGRCTQVFVVVAVITAKTVFKQLLIYRKIPQISPGPYILQRPFWRGGLTTGWGDLCFKIDWASLIVGSKFTFFALFYFVF